MSHNPPASRTCYPARRAAPRHYLQVPPWAYMYIFPGMKNSWWTVGAIIMGRGGVPGWMKPPKPFEPRKLSVPPGYKRQGYQEEQECCGGKYIGEWKDGTQWTWGL